MTREERLQFERLVEALEPFADVAKSFCCDDRPWNQSVQVVVNAGELMNALEICREAYGAAEKASS
ncbi:MAG: hypothetical protein GY791_01410 [Alphaproteobacteria bacterium]|nr:hypothetical protein [Alphaproteobacteria bacterium]